MSMCFVWACVLFLFFFFNLKISPYAWLLFNVLISPSLVLASSQTFYCIPLPVISCPQVFVGLQSLHSLHMPWLLPLSSMASASLGSKLCTSPVWVPNQTSQKPVSRQPTDGPGCCKQVLLFLPFSERDPSVGPLPSAMLGRGWARANKHTVMFSAFLNVAFSWLDICLVDIHLWLFSRALTKWF